jgi:hypothetical protein
MQVFLYEYKVMKSGYLIHMLFPDARRVAAHLCDTASHVVNQLTDAEPNAIFLFHIDLSDTRNVPLCRDELCKILVEHSFRLINSPVTMIGKHFIQSTLKSLGLPSTQAQRDGDSEEWLLIKTDRNSGGTPELKLTDNDLALLGIERQSAKHGPDRGYRLLRRRNIPSEAWTDPMYIVETYINNTADIFLRTYLSGNRIVVSEAMESATIKRMDRAFNRRNYRMLDSDLNESMEGYPLRICRAAKATTYFAKAIGLRFGCIDLAVDDRDQVFIIDVNTTPHWGTEQAPKVLEHLGPGLSEFNQW